MIQLKLSNEALDVIDSELAVTMAYEDIRPLKGQIGLVDWRLNGKVSRLILNRRFKGAKGDALLMPAGGRLGAKELLVLGMGFKRAITEAEIPEMLNIVLDRILKKKEDFQKFSGSQVQLHLYTPFKKEDGSLQKNFTGILRGLKDDKVLLEVDQNRLEILWENITMH